MSNKMLIDSTHPEETRVVVLRGSRVEEFDFEAADRQQLRGNIYLAKVTRVEPSLQAAFIEYGGNRHGFLAFSEIHPDYYQIPYADRQALIQEQAREDEKEAAEEAAVEAAEEAAAEQDDAEQDGATDGESEQDGPTLVFDAGAAGATREPSDPHAPDGASAMAADRFPGDEVSEPAPDEPTAAGHEDPASAPSDASEGERFATDAADQARVVADEPVEGSDSDDPRGEGHAGGDSAVSEIHEHHDVEQVESVGAEDALEEVPERRKPRPRQYKIQEVIKRRQVLLVQVVKEERGNKGAALTTYLSLAGRYSVLMPNTGRGGGISRKITNPADRKRLKEIASELDVPEGMGVILRTAGANRTKPEVKRDFEYLLRLWENVRELTLRSTAPKLVYEEGSLIKRSIRDLYSKEIDQIVVAGEDAYREAKDFMRMLMPSHAKNVQLYREDTPLFARSGVEAQLDAMFSPQVTLRSGGYIVINQTEALVSIDVNSGRSTREHSIEDTALNTNLEAAEEIARQLRLRDLAGLIVIDFIDMEENRNNRAVERKVKDCLRADRARIQVGRISHFGLMEMSRQRIRTGVLESSTVACPHCRGSGQVRSIASLSLQILRALEDNLLRHGGFHLYVRTRPDVALYVLNQKRRHLAELEARFGLSITVTGDAPENGAGFSVERGAQVEERPAPLDRIAMVATDRPQMPEIEDEEPEPEVPADEEADETLDGEAAAADRERRPRRRRRRRGNGEDRGDERGAERSSDRGDDRQERRPAKAIAAVATAGAADMEAGESGEDRPASSGSDEDEKGHDANRRRRGRRGGRRRGRSREAGEEAVAGGESNEFVGEQPGEEATAGDFDDAFVGADAGLSDAEPLPAGAEQPYEIEAFGLDAAADMNAASGAPTPATEPYDVTDDLTADAAGSASPESDVEIGAVDFGAPPVLATEPQLLSAADMAVDPEENPSAETDLFAPVPEPVPPADTLAAEAVTASQPIEDDRPKRSGWWSKRLFS